VIYAEHVEFKPEAKKVEGGAAPAQQDEEAHYAADA
jgi:hypothetical protein